MPTAIAKMYSWTMQVGLQAMVIADRLWGNLVIDPSGESSPHTLIAKLRGKGDVLRTYTVNGWCVISHKNVKSLLRDTRLSSEIFESQFIQRVIRSAARAQIIPIIDHPNMVNLDPPDHTRLRKLAASGFTNRFVQSLRPKIEQIANELLAEVEGKDEFDIVDSLAKPLPAIVIAEMLGVPAADRHYFEEWSAALIGYTEILNPDSIQKAVQGDLAMRDYLRDLVDQKRLCPGQDLISALIEAEEDSEKLDLEELLSTCTILLVAGHETTTRLIGNCLLLLLQHPGQFAEVKSDRSLLRNAIEETLRFEPPLSTLSRIVSETFDYEGCTFKKGQIILLSLAGANRDPLITDNPEQFNIHRGSVEHTSFGHGIHLCLGMPLAKLEAEVALNLLFDKFHRLSLSNQKIEWTDSPFFRGLERLLVGSAEKECRVATTTNNGF